jgi:hypothetical protein
MAKTVTDVATKVSSQKQNGKRQLKKQVKREKKLTFKVDLAKHGVRRVEKKVSRAQSRLENAQTRLHELEERLSQLRTARQSLNGTLSANGDTHQPEAEQGSLEVLAAAPIEDQESAEATPTEIAVIQTVTPLESDSPSDEQVVEKITETPEAAETEAVANESAESVAQEESPSAQESEPAHKESEVTETAE